MLNERQYAKRERWIAREVDRRERIAVKSGANPRDAQMRLEQWAQREQEKLEMQFLYAPLYF